MLRKIASSTVVLLLFLFVAGNAAWAKLPIDQAVESALQQELSRKFTNVRVSVDDRQAVLTGTVDKYLDKLSAEKKARKYKALKDVMNRLEVAGPAVPDAELQEKLASKIVHDRSFQGNVFDAFSLGVKDGVVTLGGFAHNYFAADSALGIVQSQAGVKDVVNRIEVLPLSGFDDRIRLVEARAIYGTAGLQKYAIDPAHPIRIIVSNGQVRLEGTVLNGMDRTLAGMAALRVGGVFSVTNNLKVERDRSA